MLNSTRLRRALTYSLVLGRALFVAPQRKLIGRMISFSRTLPQQFDQPLPLMMAQLTPAPKPANDLTTATIRQLADAIAAWHFRSPLGICLRRSLLRYYFLWEAGIPVRIVFGARLLRANEGDRIGGHAWLTLDGAPYYEDQQDYAPFAEMYHYPPDRAYPPDRPRRETQRIPDENQRNK